LLIIALEIGLMIVLAAFGYLTGISKLEPAFFLICAIAFLSGLAMLKRIEFGLVAMILSAIFVRFRLPTGTSSEIVISLLLCLVITVIWVVRMLVVDRRIIIRSAPINAPLLAFVVALLIAFVWNWPFQDVFVQDIGSPFVKVAALLVMIMLPVTLLLAVNLVSNLRILKLLVWGYVFCGLISLLILLIIALEIGPADVIRNLVYRNGVVWVNSQGLFATWYVSISLAMALFSRRLHWVWIVVLLLHVVGWVYLNFYLGAQWLSGWVPPFVAVAIVAFFRSKKLFVILLLVMVVGAGGFFIRTRYDAEVDAISRTIIHHPNLIKLVVKILKY